MRVATLQKLPSLLGAEGIEPDHSLTEPILQTSAQTWDERTLPDVIIDGNDHLHTFRTVAKIGHKGGEAQCSLGIGRHAFELIGYEDDSLPLRQHF